MGGGVAALLLCPWPARPRPHRGHIRNLFPQATTKLAPRSGDPLLKGTPTGCAPLASDLAIVSNAPYECPLCSPFEVKVPSIDGPDGSREVTVEYATEDGRTVRVHVVGSLKGARDTPVRSPHAHDSVRSAPRRGPVRPLDRVRGASVVHRWTP